MQITYQHEALQMSHAGVRAKGNSIGPSTKKLYGLAKISHIFPMHGA